MRIISNAFSGIKVSFFILLFLCFAGAILGDSIAEALILSHYNASVIPRMYMINAIFLFFSSLFLMSLIDRVDRGVLYLVFLITHCCILFILWCMILMGSTFLYIPLFSYAYITKIFMFLMFWTLANDSIDSRSAGRQFPFIAAGGTLGAICVSFAIPWLLKAISAQNLMAVWICLSVLVILFFLPIRRRYGKSFKPASDSEKHAKRNIQSMMNDLSLLKREPLLFNMSLLYFMVFFVLFNQHYTFYQVIKARFVEAEKLAGFLGYFNGTSMVFTFFIQITVAGFIIKKVGSTRAMFMLPAAFCIVFGTLSVLGFVSGSPLISAIAFNSLFWAVAGGVGMRIAFFDSFFSPNFQLFFSSLPQDIRGRGKLVIEGIVKPSAMILVSFWLLKVTTRVPFTVTVLILFVISLGMIFQTFRIRSKYTERLAQCLGSFKSRGALSLFDPAEITACKDIVSFLSDKLKNEAYDIKCYIIEILTEMNTGESLSVLTGYIGEADGKTRATVISSLGRLCSGELKPLFCRTLQDADQRVIANSITALAAYNDENTNADLQVFLHHTNNRIKANTVLSLWPRALPQFKEELLSVLRLMLESDTVDTVVSGLFVITKIGAEPSTAAILKDFFGKKKETIVADRNVWRHFLRALSANPDKELLRLLLGTVGELRKSRRNDVAMTLVEAGKNGYDYTEFLIDLKARDIAGRRIVLKTLSTQQRALSKEVEQDLIRIAQDEAVCAFDMLLSYRILRKEDDGDALQLLAFAVLEECFAAHLDSMIFIAAILDRSGQIKKVMRRLNHENSHVRARALEVLDNVGNTKVNRMILKLIDKNEKSTGEKDMMKVFGADKSSLQSIVAFFTINPNAWVRECAMYALARTRA